MLEGQEDEEFESSEDEVVDCPFNLFPFRLRERRLIKRLGDLIRARLATMDSEAIALSAKFLFALDRLPWDTNNIYLDFALKSESENGFSVIGVEITPYEFRLYTGGYSKGEFGGDSTMNTVFRVEPGGFREGSTSGFSNWFEDFGSQSGSVVIEDAEGEPIPSLPSVDLEAGWAKLKLYWEDNWDLEDDEI